jgi:DMSO/TMAO reductase YedYZ molybdopterin-dependent catalytic subunit
MTPRGITRRSLLVSTVAAAGAAAGGAWVWNWDDDSTTPGGASKNSSNLIEYRDPLGLEAGKLLDTDFPDPFAGGQLLGYLPFRGEDSGSPMLPGIRSGDGHGMRRIIDPASFLMSGSRITPADDFFIRTGYPELLQPTDDWKIQIGGEVRKPQVLSLRKLDPLVGLANKLVLLECSGNHRSLRYGLLSVGQWEGIPIGKVLEMAEPTEKATCVFVNGFDDDPYLPNTGPPYHEHSMPTCSWVFTREQLEQAGAFLATRLNGQPLPKDQGAPVRLVVPGWYGCTEMKWVNEIKLVDNNQPATLQMLEFADRTGQKVHRDPKISTFHPVGPKLAREYVPARIDQAILPVRVEQWLLGGKLTYRVVGITWGGSQRSDKLKIRFRHHANEPDYQPILFCKAKSRISPYGVWMHLWRPKKKGPYWIDVQLVDSGIPARKLHELSPLRDGGAMGHFERIVLIDHV